MKYVRFYLEYPSKTEKHKGTRKSPGDHRGTVIATFPETSMVMVPPDRDAYIQVDAIGSLFDHPNSAVCGTVCTWGYLREKCKRISETQAREVHPELFRYLDS